MPVDKRSLRNLGVSRGLVTVCAVYLLLAACASQPKDSPESLAPSEPAEAYEAEFDNDPLETLNRFIFAFDLTLDIFILKPVAATYRFILPVEVRDSIRNIIRNLRSPVVLANDLFQGETDRAETTSMRFLINSTIGVLGILDVAEDWGYAYHDEDFGQTLAVHGAGEGVYLVLPIFGPSSLRDGTGLVVDTFLDPLTYVGRIYDIENELLTRTVVGGIDTRSRNIEAIEDLQRDSIDFYARVRSLYRQTRANQIRNGTNGDLAPTPGFYSTELAPGEDADWSDATVE